MISSVLIFLTGLLGQAQGGVAEEMPYQITDTRTDETIRAFITDEELNGRGTLLNVILDEPWNDIADRQRPLVREFSEVEGRANRLLREQAIESGWISNGGVEVGTVNGTKMWVHREEWDYAERARDLAAALEPEIEETQSFSAGPVPGNGGETRPPGFIDLWGMHLLVVGLSGAVIALIVWALVLR